VRAALVVQPPHLRLQARHVPGGLLQGTLLLPRPGVPVSAALRQRAPAQHVIP